MPKYLCSLCEKEFTSLSSYRRHLARRIPCIVNNESLLNLVKSEIPIHKDDLNVLIYDLIEYEKVSDDLTEIKARVHKIQNKIEKIKECLYIVHGIENRFQANNELEEIKENVLSEIDFIIKKLYLKPDSNN
jgi:hypothetical protein